MCTIIGWLQLIKERAPEKVMKEEVKGSGKIEVGDGKTYKNLDALVYAMKEDFIASQFKNDTKLVAILGSDLLADKYFPLINETKPTEQVAADTIISQKRVGGLARHKKELKSIQSNEKKAEFKKAILPDYLPWIEGALNTGNGKQDNVLMMWQVWAIDCGQFNLALYTLCQLSARLRT